MNEREEEKNDIMRGGLLRVAQFPLRREDVLKSLYSQVINGCL
jgi:hypothetical protein